MIFFVICITWWFKGTLWRSETIFDNWKTFRSDKKCFLFHLKSSLCSQDIWIFLLTFWPCRKKVNLKIYYIITWETSSYKTHIAQYLKKWRESYDEIWSVNRIWNTGEKYFSRKIMHKTCWRNKSQALS